jgi:hypothetical protein
MMLTADEAWVDFDQLVDAGYLEAWDQPVRDRFKREARRYGTLKVAEAVGPLRACLLQTIEELEAVTNQVEEDLCGWRKRMRDSARQAIIEARILLSAGGKVVTGIDQTDDEVQVLRQIQDEADY